MQLQNCLKAALQGCFGDHLTISSLLPPRGQCHSSPPSHHSSQSLDSCDRQNSDFLPAESKPTVRHSSVPRGCVCVTQALLPSASRPSCLRLSLMTGLGDWFPVAAAPPASLPPGPMTTSGRARLHVRPLAQRHLSVGLGLPPGRLRL